MFYLMLSFLKYIYISSKKFGSLYLYLHKKTDPKIIITFVDNNFYFYTLKINFQKIKFIVIQNGYRFFKDDIFGYLRSNK